MINQDGEGPLASAIVRTMKYLEVVDQSENLSAIVMSNGYNITLWNSDDFSEQLEVLYQSESIDDEKIIDYDIDQQRQLLFVLNDRGHLFR